MPIVWKQIKSSSDPDDPRPWAEMAASLLGDGQVQITLSKINGLAASSEVSADTAKEQALCQTYTFQLTSGKEDQLHFLIVTFDGDLKWVPQDELPSVCYAHLAWYDPSTDTLTALQFTE